MTNLHAPNVMQIVSGKGCYVTDEHGRQHLEGMSGLWCTALGWGNEELVEAAAEQLRTLSYYHCYARSSPWTYELAERLLQMAPEAAPCHSFKGGRVFFGTGGSDGNDTQVRLLWHYFNAIGKPLKKGFVSRKRGYHGSGVTSGSLTGLPHVHALFDAPLSFVRAHATCPHKYRDGKPGESDVDFSARLAVELDDIFTKQNAEETIAAFIAEPLIGAGGVVIPPAGYFEAIQSVCEKHEVLIVADEVITGFGRTGHPWGCQAFGMKPHTITCAKMITSGYVPLSAVIVSDQIAEVLVNSSESRGGIMGHGFTYTGHPLATAVALKTLDIMERDGLMTRGLPSHPVGAAFKARLEALGAHPLVGESRGIGLVGAVELVADKATGAVPKAGAGKLGALCAAEALGRGLIVRSIADSVALCPPLVITEAQLHELFNKLGEALDATHAKAKASGLI